MNLRIGINFNLKKIIFKKFWSDCAQLMIYRGVKNKNCGQF